MENSKKVMTTLSKKEITNMVKNVCSLIENDDYTNVELGFFIMKGNPDLLTLSSEKERAKIESAMIRNYTCKHFCLCFGFGSLVNETKIDADYFKEIKRNLSGEQKKTYYKTDNKAVKLWIENNKNTLVYLCLADYSKKDKIKITSLPESFYKIKQMKVLYACWSSLKGFSPSIKNLTNLTDIGFCGIKSTFNIPSEIGELRDTLKNACIGSYDNCTGVSTKKMLKEILPNTAFNPEF